MSVKQCYWANLLRTLSDEDDDIIGLWQIRMVLGAVWCILGMVFHESSNTWLIMEKTLSRCTRR
jgi:hypothetical protein